MIIKELKICAYELEEKIDACEALGLAWYAMSDPTVGDGETENVVFKVIMTEESGESSPDSKTAEPTPIPQTSPAILAASQAGRVLLVDFLQWYLFMESGVYCDPDHRDSILKNYAAAVSKIQGGGDVT